MGFIGYGVINYGKGCGDFELYVVCLNVFI